MLTTANVAQQLGLSARAVLAACRRQVGWK